jgi:hypothetical protein
MDQQGKGHPTMMMKSTIAVACLLASTATAFAPSQQLQQQTALSAFAKGYVGADSVEPMLVGSSKNYDPFGFTEVRAIAFFRPRS